TFMFRDISRAETPSMPLLNNAIHREVIPDREFARVEQRSRRDGESTAASSSFPAQRSFRQGVDVQVAAMQAKWKRHCSPQSEGAGRHRMPPCPTCAEPSL